ncbi:hypothetical protein HZS_6637 [Henneguya salminicola]|nr:hypothetical protein HZS_6637 [Henneguya salminicola]
MINPINSSYELYIIKDKTPIISYKTSSNFSFFENLICMISIRIASNLYYITISMANERIEFQTFETPSEFYLNNPRFVFGYYPYLMTGTGNFIGRIGTISLMKMFGNLKNIWNLGKVEYCYLQTLLLV